MNTDLKEFNKESDWEVIVYLVKILSINYNEPKFLYQLVLNINAWTIDCKIIKMYFNVKKQVFIF